MFLHKTSSRFAHCLKAGIPIFGILMLAIVMLCGNDMSASNLVVNTHASDSMEQLLKTDLDDSTRLIVMLLQVKELAPRDPLTALEKAKKALIFSEQIKDYYVKAK